MLFFSIFPTLSILTYFVAICGNFLLNFGFFCRMGVDSVLYVLLLFFNC